MGKRKTENTTGKRKCRVTRFLRKLPEDKVGRTRPLGHLVKGKRPLHRAGGEKKSSVGKKREGKKESQVPICRGARKGEYVHWTRDRKRGREVRNPPKRKAEAKKIERRGAASPRVLSSAKKEDTTRGVIPSWQANS